MSEMKSQVRGYQKKGDFTTVYAETHLKGIQSLPRVHRPTKEEFLRDYVEKERPVIITGMMEDWRTAQWPDFDYLKAKIGDHIVHPRTMRGKKLMSNTEAMSFRQFLDTAKEKDLYLTIATLLRPSPDSFNSVMERRVRPAFLDCLGDDIEVPFFDRKDLWEANLWMGPGLSETPIHFDQYLNIYCQVLGQKRFLLFPPVNPGFHNDDRDAEGNITYEGYEYVIEPGEMLYYPAYWFHRVFGKDDWAMSVNMWFLSREKDYYAFAANKPYERISMLKKALIAPLILAKKAQFKLRKLLGNQPATEIGATSFGPIQSKIEPLPKTPEVDESKSETVK